jgi:DedD protein
MEVRVRERLIGALVLVALVVLFVPAILKGRGQAPVETPAQPTRRVEVPIARNAPPPEEQVLVPEPALPDDGPPASAGTPAQPLPRPEPETRVPAPAPAPAAAAPARPRVEAPPAASAARAPVAAATSAWAVQLGAFSNRSKAEQLVSELKKRRYAAFLLEYRASGQVLYRVRVGPEQDRARAVEIAARLAKDGFQPVVARHP